MEPHRLLARQLRKLGLDPERLPGDLQAWTSFLEAIGRTYSTADQDRYTMERSLRISSQEMRALHAKLAERSDELESQLLQAQRLESVGRLAGGVAHDFNNLLAVIIGCANSLHKALPADFELREDLGDVLNAARRGAALTRQLLTFSRKDVVRPEIVDVSGMLADMERLLLRAVGEGVELDVSTDGWTPPISIDPTQFEQVVINLAVNARDAMPAGGRLDIRASEVRLPASAPEEHPGIPPGHWLSLEVSDTGHGMTPEVADRAFEPFFTTKPRHQGTGFGLSTVYGIVKRAGGYISLRTAPGQGTSFRLYFPVAGKHLSTAEPAAGRDEVPAPDGHTVLVVEDEAAILRIMVRILRRRGYQVLSAGDVQEALGVAAGHDGTIDLLVTDVVMPGGSGREIVQGMRDAGRQAKVLYISGYPESVIDRHGVIEPGVSLLPKPFDESSLVRKVEELLGGPVAEA